jgi:transcriptional regulator with XRE-family HTH domain
MKLITGGQLRAARALLRWSADDLAAKSKIGVATVRRAEATDAAPSITEANLDALKRTLEAAGVEFTNGGQPGVRLKRPEDTHSDLKQQINHMQGRVDFDEPAGPASPKRGMQQLRGAKSKNELVKLKNRRAKLKAPKGK